MSLLYFDKMLWPGGRKKAFTLSYDDGITQDVRLVELFDRYGVKGTFNLNPGLFGVKNTVTAQKAPATHYKLTADEVKELYKNHELAGHGQVHCSMANMDMPRCIEEISGSRRALEAIVKRPVRGFAYAFGVYDDNVVNALKACGITYSRTVESTHNFNVPEDFIMWNPTCHHCDLALFELADEFLAPDEGYNWRGVAKLFYVWGHSYEFDQDNNWEMMKEFLSKISGHEDVWYATNGEICDYVNAFNQLIFTMDGKYVTNPTSTTLYMGGLFGDDFIEICPGETVSVPAPQVF